MKKILKKSALVLLSLSLCLTLSACGDGKTQSESENSSSEGSSAATQAQAVDRNAQRDYFITNTVKEYKTFDVRLRDTVTTRSIKVLSNGLNITEASISPIGTQKGGAVSLVHFSDIHFTGVNDKDKKNPAIMAIYSNRDFNKGNVKNTEAAIRSLEFGKLFNRTIITGDIIDYYSFAAMEQVKNVITDKYNVLMTLGNHEPCEIMGGVNSSSGFKEMYSLKEKYDYLEKNVYPNNISLYKEIISDGDGNEKVMTLLLDDQGGKYRFTDAQYKQLESYISEARKKQIPVLIFQHEPLSTGWADSKGFDKIEPFDTLAGNKNGVGEDWGKNSSLIGGKANKDAMSAKVYKLITKNADVIKGVFTGHTHNNVYTEILATTPSGEAVNIPQYTVSGNYNYSNVIQITVM